MIKASVVAACAALMLLTGPADACGWKRDGFGWRSADGVGYRDGWGHRRHWRGDGWGYRSGVAVGVRTGDRWDRGRRWRGDGYGWRADRTERRGLFRDRRMEADVVAK